MKTLIIFTSLFIKLCSTSTKFFIFGIFRELSFRNNFSLLLNDEKSKSSSSNANYIPYCTKLAPSLGVCTKFLHLNAKTWH